MTTTRSLLLVLALLAATPVATAHGGAYQGPGNASSTGGGSTGGGTARPTLGGGPGGSGGGSGAAAGAGGSAASGPRGGSGRASGSSGGGAAPAVSYEGWEFWWEANRDRYLHLRERLERRGGAGPSPSLLTARGGGRATIPVRPDQATIDSVVIPALEGVSRSADDRDILDSTVLAMCRSASPQTRDAARDTALALLAHRELSVQSSAALSLGVLGAADARPLLEGLVRDDAAGRAAVGGPVPWLVRSFACLGLGLLGDPASVRALMAAVEQLPDSERDIKASAIAALGLVPRGTPLADTCETWLLALLADDDLDAYIRSYVPTSLGKLGNGDSVAPLLEVYRDDDTENVVRQSAAIGLGRLASTSDEAVVETLVEGVREGHDRQSRHFSLIALAQIGARDEEPVAHAEAHAAIRKLLLREMTPAGTSRSHRSWAALAASLYARAQPAATSSLLKALREGFREERDPSFRGAFAIALALLDDQDSRALIHAEFTASHQEDFRGYAGEALGLLRHREASDELRALCADKTISPTFRLKTATSLGLLGDRHAVPVLVRTLDEAGSLGGLASAANALGLIGDETAVQPLLDMASDEDGRAASRAFACVALGLLGERSDLPFNAALREHNNYLAQFPSIAEVLRIL